MTDLLSSYTITGMKMIQVPDSMCKPKQIPSFISTEVIDRIVVYTELRRDDSSAEYRDMSRVVLFTASRDYETGAPYNYHSPWMSEDEAVTIAGQLLDAIGGRP